MKPIHPLASSASRESLELFLQIQGVALEGDVEGCLSLGCTLWASVLGLQRAWAGLMDETGEKLTSLLFVSPGTVERLPASTLVLDRGSASLVALGEQHAVFLREAHEWRRMTGGPVIVAPAYGPLWPKAILAGEWSGEGDPKQDQLDLATLLAKEVGFAISAAKRLTERADATAVLGQRVRDLEQRALATERARRLAEETGQLMRRAANRLHVALDQLPEGIAVITVPRGVLVLSNPSAGLILAPDRTGKFDAIFLREDGTQFPRGESPLVRASRGQSFGPEPVTIASRSGGKNCVTVSAIPIHDMDGIVREVLLVLHLGPGSRTSEAVESELESALAPSASGDALSGGAHEQHILDLLLESAPLGIALVSGQDHRFRMANRRFAALAGPAGLPVVTRSVAEVFPTTGGLEIMSILDEVYRTSERVTVREQSTGTPLGKDRVYWDIEYVPLLTPGGQADAILMIADDATERVTARKQIDEVANLANRRSAELNSILDNMTDAVFACDLKGNLGLINEAGKQMLGIGRLGSGTESGISLRKTLRIRHVDGSPVRYDEQPLIRALKGERVVLEDGIIYSQVAGKELHIRTSATPIRDEGGWIIGSVAVVRDVSALIELDCLKDQFITVTAHELKTPVTIIKGYSQLMLRDKDNVPPDVARMLEAINRGATRIDDIVSEILKLPELRPRGLAVEMEEVDLSKMARLAARRFEATAEKHEIVVQADSPVKCRADRIKVEQVLENLLENAAKYSPEGSTIGITVTSEPGRAVVSVQDSGIGIPSQKKGQLFERFYSAHTGTAHDYGGLGLGLFLSREIVTLHGGEMWFESEEGVGSCFHFSLPLAVANG